MEGLTGSIEVAARALGAGLCMGLGAIGPAIGEGNAVGKALEGMYQSGSLRLQQRCTHSSTYHIP